MINMPDISDYEKWQMDYVILFNREWLMSHTISISSFEY